MMLFRNRPISIMVLFAVTLHLTWAVNLIFGDASLNITAINAIHHYIPSREGVGTVLAGAALLALVGLYTRSPWVVLLLIPQQMLLMMSAAGSIEAMWLGQYANGQLRAYNFIISEQMYSTLAAVFHTIAIVAHARRINR